MNLSEMNQKTRVVKPSDAKAALQYADMTGAQKLTWWGKLLVALASFGFIFPHIMEARLRQETYLSPAYRGEAAGDD